MEKPFQVCYSRVMKDGYFAQDNGSSMEIQKILEIMNEQLKKQSEQIEKQSELIEKLYDKIEQKDEIIRKLQKMLFGRKSEKAAALEMMANMEPLFDMDYPEPKQEERTGTVSYGFVSAVLSDRFFCQRAHADRDGTKPFQTAGDDE